MVGLVKPVYAKGTSGPGRPPVPLERMLRIHQHWFNLSEPAVEEALYESVSMRRFVGIDLGREPVPDETTVCKFRHLRERIFEAVGAHLPRQGLKVSSGSIVEATLIAAPRSGTQAPLGAPSGTQKFDSHPLGVRELAFASRIALVAVTSDVP